MKNYLRVVVMALSVILLSACDSSSGSNGSSNSVVGGSGDSDLNVNESETIKSISISITKEEDGTYTFKSVSDPVVSGIKYTWDFGGRVNQPDQSSVANPVVTYVDEGDYAVQLIAEVDGKKIESNILNVSYYLPVKVVTNYTKSNDVITRGYVAYGGAVTDKKLYIWGDGIDNATHYNVDNGLIKELASTYQSYVVLTYSGKVYTYGYNTFGTLGDNTTTTRKEFKVVEGLDGVSIKKIYASMLSVYAIDTNGNVWCWGSNERGQLGIGNTTNSLVPVQIKELKNIVSLAVGVHAVFALDKDGQVYCWGNNASGELGLGHTTRILKPVKLDALADKVITGIYVDGYDYSIGGFFGTVFAIDKDGKLYGWGSNEYKLLGENPVNNKVPNLIEGLKDKFIVSVAQNRHGSVYVVDKDGKAYSWGNNGSNGKLGHGDTLNLSEPKMIEYFNTNNIIVRKIFASGDTNTAYALDSEGKIYGWGNDWSNQIGQVIEGNYATSQSLPIYVEMLSNDKIVYVENGNGNGYAVTNTGKVYVSGNRKESGMSNQGGYLSSFTELIHIPALK